MGHTATAIGLFLLLMLGALAPQSTGQKSTAAEKEWIYRIQPARPDMLKTGPTTEEMGIVQDHFNHLKELTTKGVVIFAGRTLTDDEDSFGIVVFHAASEEAALEVMNGDPAVRKGVMKAKLFPFHVALMQGKPVE